MQRSSACLRSVFARSSPRDFSTFLDDEGVNFIDFVNALEEEAAERIFAHLRATLGDQAPSQPVSSPLGQSVPTFAAASSDATSAEFTFVGNGDCQGALASHSSADIASFQAGTDPAWSLSTPGGDTGGATKWLNRRAGPRQRRAAAALELDEGSPSHDRGAGLHASGIAYPGGAEHL